MITVEKCPCGHPGCRSYWLKGVGVFRCGSGFALDEANRIAALLNADEAAPAPTDEDLALAERCRDAARDQYIEDARVEIDADADVAQSADEQGAFVQAWVWVDAEDL